MTIRERPIRNDADFEAMMLEGDEQLRKEGVPIPARELRSLGLVRQAVGLDELRVYPATSRGRVPSLRATCLVTSSSGFAPATAIG